MINISLEEVAMAVERIQSVSPSQLMRMAKFEMEVSCLWANRQTDVGIHHKHVSAADAVSTQDLQPLSGLISLPGLRRCLILRSETRLQQLNYTCLWMTQMSLLRNTISLVNGETRSLSLSCPHPGTGGQPLPSKHLKLLGLPSPAACASWGWLMFQVPWAGSFDGPANGPGPCHAYNLQAGKNKLE